MVTGFVCACPCESSFHAVSILNYYVLACDAECIEKYNEKPKKKESIISTHRIPVPFKGDKNAPVVILSNNPGIELDEDDQHKRPDYIEIKKKNLLHEPQEYPFYSLNPALSDVSSYKYWHKRLRTLIENSSQKRVAERIFLVEFFPYLSTKFDFDELIIPSQKYSFSLVEKAIECNSLIVILRGQKLWFKAIPDLKKHENKFVLHSPRSSYLTMKNCGNDSYSKLVELINIDRFCYD